MAESANTFTSLQPMMKESYPKKKKERFKEIKDKLKKRKLYNGK